MRILVTDSDTRSALAAVRSLGRSGHTVIAAGVRYPSLAAVSKFATRFVAYPDPALDPQAFMSALPAIAEDQQIDVILPMTEITTLLVTELQSQLPERCRVPFPATDIVDNASNKAFVIQTAKRLGVPVPHTVILQSPEDSISATEALPYPIVVKPARSRVRVGSNWISTGVQYAETQDALRQTIQALPRAVYPILLQERIEGHGVGIFTCFDSTGPLAFFSHRRCREKPPSGGVSVLCESIPADPAAVAHATRLLQELTWRGVAMVEFKQDIRDGSLRLMEINGRFWGSLQLAIRAGIDFPGLAVALTDGHAQSVGIASQYRVGVQSRWLSGDVDAMLMLMIKSRKQLNLPPSHPSRWRTLWEFLHFFGSHLSYEIEQADDFAPARLEWSRRLPWYRNA